MRAFEYFLFENFDPDQEARNPCNPRNFLGKSTDAILSLIAQNPVSSSSYEDFCKKFGDGFIRRLIDGGILRCSQGVLFFDCPVFLQEDAAVLRNEISAKAAALAGLLESKAGRLRTCCAGILNGFSVERNLYHILCGMVFDGRFFDYLSGRGALAVSREHPCGLDYLNILYEKCDALQELSDGLLCSYNRLVNESCSLQSFGDACGDRFDFYRLFRLLEQNMLPESWQDVKALLCEQYGGADKNALLSDVVSLHYTGRCAPAVERLLTRFGYMHNGRICVPVYTPAHQKHIAEIGDIVEDCIGEPMAGTLMELAALSDITAVRHGVNRLETANELYHLVFGFINEALVLRGIVTAPPRLSGEGRYLKCIELY